MVGALSFEPIEVHLDASKSEERRDYLIQYKETNKEVLD